MEPERPTPPYRRQSADRGKSPMEPGRPTPPYRQQAEGRGRSPMTDDMSTDVSTPRSSGHEQMDPKDMDLGHILDDVDLKNSKNIRDAVQKAKTKLNQEVVNLLISNTQMTQDETQAKIDRVLLKVKRLDEYFFPGERHAGTIEHDTPFATDHVSLPSGQSETQNETPQTEHESADEDQGPVHGEEHDFDAAVPAFPGSFRVTSTGTFETTFLVDEDLIPYKMEKIPGNDVFYKHLNDWSLELFGPTIRTWWNRQSKVLKDELIARLVGFFGAETFNQKKVLEKAGQHLHYVREQYRNNLADNPKYERPPMIPTTEWKGLLDDAREKAAKIAGKPVPESARRLPDTSKATQARIEKHGQHKLGPGGYSNLQARIAQRFHDLPTEEDMRIGYQRGFSGVVEHRTSSRGSQANSSSDPSCEQPHNESRENAEDGGERDIEVHVDRNPEGLHVQLEAAAEDQTQEIHVTHELPVHPGTLQQPHTRREHTTRRQTRSQAATEGIGNKKQLVEEDVTLREFVERKKRQKK